MRPEVVPTFLNQWVFPSARTQRFRVRPGPRNRRRRWRIRPRARRTIPTSWCGSEGTARLGEERCSGRWSRIGTRSRSDSIRSCRPRWNRATFPAAAEWEPSRGHQSSAKGSCRPRELGARRGSACPRGCCLDSAELLGRTQGGRNRGAQLSCARSALVAYSWTVLRLPSRFRARRARRVRRAFESHPREHAIPISGVAVPGNPPRWTWAHLSGSARSANFLPNASARNLRRTPHPPQTAVNS
jgi:hypothetical protein